MGLKVTNNAFGTLNAGINSTDTVIVLEAGQGARFPVLSAGDYFYATLIDTSNQLEIVKVTARATDTMTVVRTQDGTSSRAYNVNDRFELRPTAALFNEIIESIENIPPATPTQVSDQANTSTGSFSMPVGTTAQRPGSPVNGMVRYNTTLNKVEAYENGAWVAYVTLYDIEFLVIAGGAASDNGYPGGGAGGYRCSVPGESSGGGASAEPVLAVLSGVAYTVVVGAGAGGRSNGSNSVFESITSLGGGFGGSGGSASNATGNSGGSGGGRYGSEFGGSAGSGTTGQGFAGGLGTNGITVFTAGGGGGGAGGAGGNSSQSAGGNGGAGVTSSITGTAVARAGGGPGYSNSTGVNGTAVAGAGRGVNATANTGSGAGGSETGGLQGGSGIVIIRYAGAQRGTGGTVTSSGGSTIHTFTSSGTFTA